MSESNAPDLSNAYQRLKPRQRKFIDRLCVCGKKAQAAAEAGYGPKRPDVAAAKLFADPLVRAAYEQRMDEISVEAGVEAQRVVQEVAKLGFANMLDYVQIQEDGSAYFDLSKINRDQGAAISELIVEEYVEGRGDEARNVKRIKLKLSDKKANLELLGKHLKLWTEKHEHSHLSPPVFNISFEDGGPGSTKPADDGVETS